jgi:hypothetical protein
MEDILGNIDPSGSPGGTPATGGLGCGSGLPLDLADRLDQRLLIDVGVGVDGGRDVSVAQQLLSGGDPGGGHHPRSHGVTEHVGSDLDAGAAGEHPQPCLEGAVGQRVWPPTAQADPRGLAWSVATLVFEIEVEQAPELVGDRDAVFVACALEPHHDRRAAAIQIGHAHPEHPVASMLGAPVPDPLSRAGQQHQQRLVPPRPRGIDKPIDLARVEDRRQLARLAASQLGPFAAWWSVPAPTHRVRQLRGPGSNRTDPASPSATALGVAVDQEGEERREHTQAVVDRPRGTTHWSRLSRRQVDHTRGAGSLTRAGRELANICLDVTARHHVKLAPGPLQPTREVGQPKPIGTGRVATAPAPLQVLEELLDQLLANPCCLAHRSPPAPSIQAPTDRRRRRTATKVENSRQDISQTDGEPIPETPRPRLLKGQAPEGLWDGLADQIEANGFGLRLVSNAAAIGGANGLTDYMTREVSVRMHMDDASQVKTLAHELGHVLLHGPDNDDAAMHRGVAEVEAESVALMVASAHGLDTSSYTVPYVSTWASSVPGKSPVEVVQATAERVRGASVAILDKLDTRQVNDGNPPGLDREALATQPNAPTPEPLAQRQVEVLGR